ncbi:YqeG family HAD IIIA-type phosphatase [Savagea sp. SN6]|uniref:YqeG family HAD IIIA-type phosphatase n=1 Tax=Savagea serpentis TaxID=2785297 RepID=A0A8J7G0Y1_9BACL|nr:YqeG family HAD IIIA-type phosphatase [Savagea serpentis]MBF4500140.1 YqeG family HAD IIIA-type phosphatase [Savagea serpentis]
MLRRFTPTAYTKSFRDITPERLQERGIRAVITDLDNTLIEWNRAHATDEVIAWIRSIERAGIQVILMSNNNEERVNIFAEPLGVRYIARANKPLQGAYKKARQMLQVKDSEIVCVGDQLMTDILGANRARLQSILVLPIVTSDAKATKFNRFVESKIMKKLVRQGLQVKEGLVWNN